MLVDGVHFECSNGRGGGGGGSVVVVDGGGALNVGYEAADGFIS